MTSGTSESFAGRILQQDELGRVRTPGAEREAILDPFEYVRDVLDRIPSMTNRQIPELTPEAWAKARRPALQRAA